MSVGEIAHAQISLHTKVQLRKHRCDCKTAQTKRRPNFGNCCSQEYDPNDPNSDFTYNHNTHEKAAAEQVNNTAAGYWFGIFYVLFYLLDTFTNVPYEALGPEMHPDPDVRPLICRASGHLLTTTQTKPDSEIVAALQRHCKQVRKPCTRSFKCLLSCSNARACSSVRSSSTWRA